jgi:predicted amidohydrolase YtcJ
MRLRRLALVCGLWAGSAPLPASLAAPRAPDLLLTNGVVMTLDLARPGASAIAVTGDRIMAVGSDREILQLAGPESRQVDLRGTFVLPGLGDAHVHLRSLGEQLTSLDLRGIGSVPEIARRVHEAASRLPVGAWLNGIGWDQNLWPDKAYPDHRALTEAADDRPVWLQRIDWYAGWANRRAMQAAGITRATPDPPGGRILRDADGEPTGLFMGEAMALVANAQPAPPRATVKAWLRRALARCAEVGLTSVHDAAVTPEEATAFRELADADELPLRVYLMWKGYGGAAVEPLLEQPPLVDYRSRLTLRALKLIIDGTMGSHGALFFQDYADQPGNAGFFVTPAAEIRRLAELALRKGYQVATHAIGDRGISLTLDALEQALAAVPTRDARPRIEHLQCVRREDLARAKQLGVIASMQPSHATSEWRWSETRVGPERGRGLYALRWVLEAEIPLAAGSDLPVDSESPLAGIHAAVTRRDAGGEPARGWHPEQRLTLDEAVRAYTFGPALAAFEELYRGRIAPGFRADLTVLASDLRQVPVSEIPRIPVVATLVGGRFAYQAPAD